MSCIKREERRNKLRSILNLLLYDSMLSRISSCTHSRTEMESRVAVLADDDEYDYYLMKVSKVPFQLERVENDDWGNTFPVGANVVRGYYYNRRKQNPFK
jgi:hypothetical protein